MPCFHCEADSIAAPAPRAAHLAPTVLLDRTTLTPALRGKVPMSARSFTNTTFAVLAALALTTIACGGDTEADAAATPAEVAAIHHEHLAPRREEIEHDRLHRRRPRAGEQDRPVARARAARLLEQGLAAQDAPGKFLGAMVDHLAAALAARGGVHHHRTRREQRRPDRGRGGGRRPARDRITGSEAASRHERQASRSIRRR